MPLIGRRPWAFAALYVGLSLAVEIFLMVVVRLRIPEDNAVIAPVILTVPPLLAAGLSGYRRPPRDFGTVAALAAVLTLLITAVVTRLTGVNTGLVEPIINRSAAGWLAAAITNRRAAARAGGESSPAPAKVIAERFGVTRQAVHRLLKSLMARG